MPLVENDPSARIQFRRIGELQPPGSCYVCGSGNCEEGYLDFGTFVDYHGTFYLCMTCFAQSAAVAKYYSHEEVLTQVGNLEAYVEQVDELREQVKEANEYVSAVNRVLKSRFSADLGANSDLASNDAPEPEPELKLDPQPVRRPKDRESESTESVKGPGSKHSSRSTNRNVAFR